MLRIHKIRPECIGCINPNLCILPKTSRNDNFRFEAPAGLNTSPTFTHHGRGPETHHSIRIQQINTFLWRSFRILPQASLIFSWVVFFGKLFSFKKSHTQIHVDSTHPKTNKKHQGYWFYHTCNISAGHQSSDRAKGQAPPAKYQAKEQPFLHTASKKQKIRLLRVVYNWCWKQFVSKLLLHRDTIQYARRYDKFE